jgi:hypothetical protein
MLGLAGSAMASTITGNTPGVKPATEYSYTPPDGPRQGGDLIGSATAIGALPFSDNGTTVGYFHDYDEICPYSGSLSPDVVYSFVPGAGVDCINVDLCNSSYDTKVYIYENAQGNLIACNDDFYFGAPCYVYSSAVNNVAVVPGNTYYIVVDGYGSASGSYQIDVTACVPPPPLECPDAALPVHENEPACQDNYVDNWNGGCNSTPAVFQVLDASIGGCGTMCGLTCTYLYLGSSYRDTDWFDSIGMGGNVTQTCMTDFPFMMALMYGPNCNNLLYIYILGNAGVPGSQSYPINAGAHVWSFMAPSVFSGLPSGQYTLEVCNIQGGPPNPTETTSWGAIKNTYAR